MVSIMIVSVLAIVVSLGLFFGLKQAQFEGDLGERLSQTARSIVETAPKGTIEEGKSLITEFPVNAFAEYFFGGVKEVANWIVKLMDVVFGTAIRFVNPNITIPPWLYLLSLVLLVGYFTFTHLGTLMDFIYDIGTVIAVGVAIIFIVGIIFIYMLG